MLSELEFATYANMGATAAGGVTGGGAITAAGVASVAGELSAQLTSKLLNATNVSAAKRRNNTDLFFIWFSLSSANGPCAMARHDRRRHRTKKPPFVWFSDSRIEKPATSM